MGLGNFIGTVIIIFLAVMVANLAYSSYQQMEQNLDMSDNSFQTPFNILIENKLFLITLLALPFLFIFSRQITRHLEDIFIFFSILIGILVNSFKIQENISKEEKEDLKRLKSKLNKEPRQVIEPVQSYGVEWGKGIELGEGIDSYERDVKGGNGKKDG